MKNVRLVGIGVLLVAVASAGLLFDSASAQKKGKTREATTKQLMKGLVNANCKALGAALKAEKTDWEEVALRAALLNEAGHILMADGRCPSGDWAKAAKTVQGCSKVLLAKVEEKDLEGAKSAFGALTKGGCAVCHKAHRSKK